MRVKYLKKKKFDYSSLLYNYKSYNLQKQKKKLYLFKIKNVKFLYKSYAIFIHMLEHQQIHQSKNSKQSLFNVD